MDNIYTCIVCGREENPCNVGFNDPHRNIIVLCRECELERGPEPALGIDPVDRPLSFDEWVERNPHPDADLGNEYASIVLDNDIVGYLDHLTDNSGFREEEEYFRDLAEGLWEEETDDFDFRPDFLHNRDNQETFQGFLDWRRSNNWYADLDNVDAGRRRQAWHVVVRQYAEQLEGPWPVRPGNLADYHAARAAFANSARLILNQHSEGPQDPTPPPPPAVPEPQDEIGELRRRLAEIDTRAFELRDQYLRTEELLVRMLRVRQPEA